MESSRWKLLFSFLAIVALFALVAAACGDDDDDTGDDTEEPTATAETTDDTTATTESTDDPTATAEPADDKFGGEITVHNTEFQLFDPHESNFSQDLSHESLVWRGLYRISAEGVPVPEMAASMPDISADGLTYTVKLQEGLLWSDGDDLTAEDFVMALQRSCSYEILGGYQYIAANIVGCDDYYDETNVDKSADDVASLLDGVGVRAIDETTLEITLLQPQPTFTIILAMWVAFPVPTHIVTEPGQEWPNPEELAFNGPFQVESYTPTDNIVFVRNDNYAGAHLAYLDKITYKYIEDNGTANNAFRSGELEMARADTSNFAALQDEFGDEMVSTPSTVTIGLQMNLSRPGLDNPLVRLAIAQAMDRETINSVILQNANVATTTWTPPSVAGLDCVAIDCFPSVGYDPEAAKQNLADAGFPGGEGLPTFEYMSRESPANEAIAAFLKQEWKEVLGMEIEIIIVDTPTYSERYNGLDYDFAPGGWGQDYPDPENWVLGLFKTDAPGNHYACSDPDIDRLVDLAQFNTDDEERRDQYREINAIISERLCGIATWYHRANTYLISSSVGGAREFTNSNDFTLPGDWTAEDWYLID